ncbi:hypothetical protein [Methylobacterium iners]|uniref:Uncharacterized protein n=1 Tax=Methylobacterium iners TaxID=418707 RepID=A0ABQ4S5T5_9HYPH|nr:hypothetical protein [Methylobacterium iners]GJD97747.1 hypothetical protein OCOJLMKI_4980 [Methylobacterium iners]
MAASFTERLIERLRLCPCCKAPVQTVIKQVDGIPAEHIHETAFMCGARVFVSKADDYSVSAGCPYAVDDALQDFRQDLIEEFRAAEDVDGGDR